MDATGTEQAVLVGLSPRRAVGDAIAADQPDRVVGVVAIARPSRWPPMHVDANACVREPIDDDRGVGQVQPPTLASVTTPTSSSFFVDQMFTEAALDEGDRGRGRVGLTAATSSTPTTASTHAARKPARSVVERVRCPVLVVHGDDDRVRPMPRATRSPSSPAANSSRSPGPATLPHFRDPVLVNRLRSRDVRPSGSGAMRALLARREGDVERDGVEHPLGGLRRGGHDRPAGADVVDHPRADLEGPGPVPRPARHRVVTFDGRGTGRSDRPHDAERYRPEVFAADRSPCSTPRRTDERCSSRTVTPLRGRCELAADHPERVAGLVAIARASRAARRTPTPSARAPVRHDELDDDGRVGQVQPLLLAGAAATATSSSSSRPVLHRAALDQAARGLRRLGARDRPGDADRHDEGLRRRAGRESFARSLRAGARARAGDPRRRRPLPAAPGPALAELTGGELVVHRRRAGTCPRRDPVRSTG